MRLCGMAPVEASRGECQPKRGGVVAKRIVRNDRLGYKLRFLGYHSVVNVLPPRDGPKTNGKRPGVRLIKNEQRKGAVT